MLVGMTSIDKSQDYGYYEDTTVCVVFGTTSGIMIARVSVETPELSNVEKRRWDRRIHEGYKPDPKEYQVKQGSKAFETLVVLCKQDSKCVSIDREYELGDCSKFGFFLMRNSTDQLTRGW